MRNKLLIAIAFIFSILFLSTVQAAVTCNPSSITISYKIGNPQPSPATLTCGNSDPNVTVNISGFGDASNLFSFSPSSIEPESTETVTITFNIPSTTEPGTYSGGIQFDDGSTPIPITIIVEQQQQLGQCSVTVFPTTLTNVKVKQGETKTRYILVTVPNCYESPVNFLDVQLQTNAPPIELGELQLGTLNPGDSIQIPLVFDATDVETGTYYDVLMFFMQNASGYQIQVPTVSISVTVVSGISPITNTTFSSFPSCSLSATNLALNSTYTLTCTMTDPNIRVVPQYSDYFKPVYPYIEETTSMFKYYFKPAKLGETTFIALFTYKGIPVGEYKQDVTITSVGMPVPGAYLKFKFYPPLEELVDGSTVSVLVLDNKTNSVVDAILYLNGVQLNNNSFTVKANKTYELVASAPNYLSASINFTVSPKTVSCTFPSEIFTDGVYNISVEPNNTVVTVNGIQIPLENWMPTKAGKFEVVCSAPGYQSKTFNITIKEKFKVTYSPDAELKDIDNNGIKNLKKGETYFISFNQNCTSQVLFNPFGTETLTVIANSTGSSISFTADEVGYYYVEANGERIRTYELTKRGIPGWVWFLIIAIIIIAIFFIRSRSTSPVSYPIGGTGEELIKV